MIQSNTFVQITFLLLGLAMMAVVLSTQTYDPRPRFRDAAVPYQGAQTLDIATARGLRAAGQGVIDPALITPSRARN